MTPREKADKIGILLFALALGFALAQGILSKDE